MTRKVPIVFPSFSGQDYQPFEIRQLVSAIELRFQALEEDSSIIPATDEYSDEYAPVGHTHVEADITDLDNYLTNINLESIFDLSDVTGTPDSGDLLVWNGSAFEPVADTGVSVLDDLLDVTIGVPNDNDVLRYSSETSQWEPVALSGGGVTEYLDDLLDVTTGGSQPYDLFFTPDALVWGATAGQLSWNPDLDYLQLANLHSINWLDSTSTTSIEMLIVEGVPNPVSSDWGSNINDDWTYDSIAHGATALKTTGILQHLGGNIDVLHISDDGLNVIVGNINNDGVESHLLDSPYDFSNSTRTGSRRAITNPNASIQWIDSGNSYIVQLGSANALYTYGTTTPYVVASTNPQGVTVSNSALGFPSSGESSYWMSRDGTRLVGVGEGPTAGQDLIRVFTLSTPYNISTYSLDHSTRIDNITNGPTAQFKGFIITDDGLTLIGVQSSTMYIGTMTAAYDVTTLAFEAGNSRSVQTDTGTSEWIGMIVSTDGNSMYPFCDQAANGQIALYTKNVSNPALLGEGLTVGDPAYLTRIDGTDINVTATGDINLTATGAFNVSSASVDLLGLVWDGTELVVGTTSNVLSLGGANSGNSNYIELGKGLDTDSGIKWFRGTVQDSRVFVDASENMYFTIDETNAIGTNSFNWQADGSTIMTLNDTGNLDVSSGLDVTGDITVTGTLTGALLTNYSIESVAYTPTGTTQTLTYSDGPSFEVDLESVTGNATITLSGGPAADTYGRINVLVTQDSVTARTVTWAGGTFVWDGGSAHPVTTTLDGFTVYTFETWDGGTTWFGSGADYS